MQKSGYSIRQLVIIGLAICLSTAVLDVSIGIVMSETKFLLFRAALLPLAVTAGISFILFSALWFLIVTRLVKIFGFDETAAAISLGVFIAITILLISVNYIDFYAHIKDYWLELLVFMLISIFASAVTYHAVKRVCIYQNGGLVGSILSLLIPLLLTEIMILILLNKHGTYTDYDLTLGFFSIALLTLGLFFVFVKSRFDTVIPLCVLMFAALVVCPIIFVCTSEKYEPSANNFKPSTNHKIKRVILISIDTLRSDVLSSYGSKEVSTPNIDSIAADGTLFKNAFSAAPWTLPSFSSMMTGVSPTVHKTYTAESRLPDKFITIAEYLRDAGYHTAAIGDNVFLQPEFNLNKGFLEYNFFPKRQTMINSFGATIFKKFFSKKLIYYASTTDLTDLSIDWLEKNQDKEFFLWVHYYNPHLPYTPPIQYISKDAVPDETIGYRLMNAVPIRNGHFAPNASQRKWIKELYNAEVRYVDDSLGRLLDRMKEMNLYKNSLIILLSDHGEEFWDHNGFEHGHTLYNELLHVPLIIKLPGAQSAKTIDEKVTTQSLMATVIDLTGIKNKNPNITAESLVPLLKDNPNSFIERPLISTGILYFENREAVIFDGMKYIQSLVTSRGELYNLNHDPGEQNPLPLGSNESNTNQAKDILSNNDRESEKQIEQLGVSVTGKVNLDEEQKEKLKALNYIQ
ncbi:MAG: sulfatase-like hydrolase/transferase [Thermodesulfobacteriota bacterium]